MSTSITLDRIDYPESDGQPMGETDLHRKWMIRIEDILQYRYRDQRVYVASDLLVYYQEGHPTQVVVPDNFVVLDCDPSMRRVFKTWKEGRVPDVVFEVTSLSTSTNDLVDKPKIYERIGVQEYFLYDPTEEYLDAPLQGFRLDDEGLLAAIPLQAGKLTCETLGIELRRDGRDLQMFDSRTSELLLREAEAERQAKEVERRGREAAEAQVRQLQEEIKRFGEGKAQ